MILSFVNILHYIKVMFFQILKFKNTFASKITIRNAYLKIFILHRKMCFQPLNLKSKISSEIILSKNNKENCVSLLKSMKHVGVKNKNIKKAAVLVLLCTVEKELSFLYTIRAHNLKSNGGQVAFPGGMQDKQDLNLEETALRETFEEIGIHKNKIDIWGKGPEIYRSDVVVTPILGYIEDLNINSLKSNLNEVALVFSVSLNHLLFSKNFRTTQFRVGKTHLFKSPVYTGDFQRIWGLTAVITYLTLSALIPKFYNIEKKFDLTSERIINKTKDTSK